MREAKDVAQKSRKAHDVVRCNAMQLTVRTQRRHIVERLTVHVGYEYLIHLSHLDRPASLGLERELTQGAFSAIYHCES